jgi:exodeoxyribonuclease VII small subunit
MTDQSPAGPSAGPAGVAELSYEQARAELAAVVERLEAGGCTLEEALALWERGEALADVCQRRLDGARARLDEARSHLDGARARPETEPPQ